MADWAGASVAPQGCQTSSPGTGRVLRACRTNVTQVRVGRRLAGAAVDVAHGLVDLGVVTVSLPHLGTAKDSRMLLSLSHSSSL